ncbi:hypothetical protein ISN45_Aa04g002880 [Arabidopsis thaliana x Arabidopsis arenosa]|uniref:Uncharacterized protein n=1 Tax=Arabidopsis thaliana x Arabidopsis arenosa TaxID=1240361 RepID=A0A8T2A6N5_9BRAS|nr:hypothetical protein ISN45_Aa04g002880 [Arabidopsis thaliana x Arabidopsis arenosa]
MAIKPPISPIPMNGSKITVHQRKRERFRDPLCQAHFDLQAVYHMRNCQRLKMMHLQLVSHWRFRVCFTSFSVTTLALTKSFGWDTYDSFMQHDVQELN